jgi:hypothetical protein
MDFAVAGMFSTQQTQQCDNGVLVNVVLGQNEHVFVGLGAVRSQDVVPFAARIRWNEMRFARFAPGVASFGIVFYMHSIAEVDSIVGSQFAPHFFKPPHELPLCFGVCFAWHQAVLLVSKTQAFEQRVHPSKIVKDLKLLFDPVEDCKRP